ncbi:ROK family transcriptional regulator [Gracilibacillus salitolerans]|uniref:ROK family transcriptional regulator n=1 Tax=Gracilibacillus salitolerans TaxID=2663022 RepID=UPI001891F159|nr:ROK family transcriptional regulator [Gracilibacillus salitolerans]
MGSTSLKQINKKRVLHYIKKNGGYSRSDIAKGLLISKPTVSNIVDELLEEGLVREKESERASSAGGRKPYQIYFNQDAFYIVGIDIGGTSIEIAVMNLIGFITDKTSFDTQRYVEHNLVNKIATTVTELLEKNRIDVEKVYGVGVGVPGITDVEKGIVIDAPSIGWKNTPLKEQLESLLPYPVYIDNDVNVAALGEQWKGTGNTNKNFLMITLGTGIGCGLIINGELYRGSSYAAGEIGYMITDKVAAEEKYDYAFHGYGFLDSHVGGPSITRRMLRHLQENNRDKKDLSAKKIFLMASEGDEAAIKIVNESVSHLAYALVNVISIVNPGLIILGGGISKSMNSYLTSLETTIEKHLPVKTDIVITNVEDVSLIGAGYLLLREHESILKV